MRNDDSVDGSGASDEVIAVIGAGPAGAAAAWELSLRGVRSTVLERHEQVGGLSKTVEYKGCLFDVGPHRFFTKSQEVRNVWEAALGKEFIKVQRLTRIFYRNKLVKYPLQPVNALLSLGLFRSIAATWSFLWRGMFPRHPEVNLETWVSNRFGVTLYEAFFRTYTEKVWGMPCSEISADWAAQRIRNMSLGAAIVRALGIGDKKKVASMVDSFKYPRRGAGQMYEAMIAKAVGRGSELRTNSRVRRIEHTNARITALVAGDARMPVRGVISSMPITDLVLRMDPQPPREVHEAATALRYRAHITVSLIVDADAIDLPDNWIYIHSPEVTAGRLILYKNWSDGMVDDPSRSTVALEYFVFEDDKRWNATVKELIDLAKTDLRALGLYRNGMVRDGFVLRSDKAYPIYDFTYARRLSVIRAFLDPFENLVCIGRAGQFRYNNMDHSVMTGLLGARRLLGEDVDPWAVNEDALYHEEPLSSAEDA